MAQTTVVLAIIAPSATPRALETAPHAFTLVDTLLYYFRGFEIAVFAWFMVQILFLLHEVLVAWRGGGPARRNDW